MDARVLRKGEKITGRYKEMQLGSSKKFFRLLIGDQEIYLPKDVGTSLLKSREKGNEVFTIRRTNELYEIVPVLEGD
jgi:hypothetical protein